MYNFDLNAIDELKKSDDPKINAQKDSAVKEISPKEKEIMAKSRADKEKIVYSGFIAQDVEKAAQSIGYDFSGVDAPENGKGAYGLRYAEFVVPFRSYTEENTTTNLSDAVVAQCKLYQNTPNPFNQDTQIKYFIPENVGVAQLCIYNLQGTQIRQILITQRGEDSQWISGSELVAGIYLYALIVDGKEVDTKRMILTK